MPPIDGVVANATPLETSNCAPPDPVWPGLVWRELLATATLMRRGLCWIGGILLALTLLLAILLRPDWQSHAALIVLLGPEYGYRTVSGDPSAINAAFDHDEILATEIGILNAADLHRAVIDSIGLPGIYPDLARKPGLIARITRAILHASSTLPDSASGTSRATTARDPADPALGRFDTHFDTLAERQASIIRIAFAHPDPHIAQRTLQTLISLYLARRAQLFADHQSPGIDTQVDTLRAHLASADAQLARFKARNNISDYAARLEILLHEQGDAERDQALAENQAAQEQARLASLSADLHKTPARISQSSGTDLDVRLAALRAAIAGLQEKRQSMLARYRPESAPMRALDLQLSAMTADLHREFATQTPGTFNSGINPVYVTADTQRVQTAADLRAATARVRQDGLQLAALHSEIAALDTHAETLDDLQRSRTVIAQSLADAIHARDTRRIAEQIDKFRQGNVRIITAPDLPLYPDATRRLILLAGLLTTAMTLSAIIIGRNLLRRQFLLAETLEADTNIPILAVIAEFSAAERARFDPAQVQA